MRLFAHTLQPFHMPSTEIRWYFSLPYSSLDWKPSNFAALSYTWWSWEPPVTISFSTDSHADDALVSTTEKFAGAVLELVSCARGCPIWIDVCISQEDDEKKSCQVLLMLLIYQYVENGFDWFGLDTETGSSVGRYICEKQDTVI